MPEGELPITVLVADDQHAAYIEAGYIDAFEFASGPGSLEDANLILKLIPRALLEVWTQDLGATRVRQMSHDDLIWEYLYRLGYLSADAVFIVAHNDWTGDTAGGETVTINGSGFASGHPGTTHVTVDGVPFTSVVVIDNQTITAVSPAHVAEEDLDLVVTNDNGSFTMPAAIDYAAP